MPAVRGGVLKCGKLNSDHDHTGAVFYESLRGFRELDDALKGLALGAQLVYAAGLGDVVLKRFRASTFVAGQARR